MRWQILSKKWLKATFSSFYGFRIAQNMKLRPGKRAGTDPLQRAGRVHHKLECGRIAGHKRCSQT